MIRDRNGAGQYWEDAASTYLKRQGIRTLMRRYRCRMGELDLVCTDETTLIVVEVRARSSRHVVSALASIDARKRRRIILATRHLLMRHPAWYNRPLRFDVIAIDDIDAPTPSFQWIANAFDAA